MCLQQIVFSNKALMVLVNYSISTSDPNLPVLNILQRDPIIAKQLFGSLFSGILKEVDKHKTMSEKNIIPQKLLQDFNHFLNTTYSFFPPFVSCIQVRVHMCAS